MYISWCQSHHFTRIWSMTWISTECTMSHEKAMQHANSAFYIQLNKDPNTKLNKSTRYKWPLHSSSGLSGGLECYIVDWRMLNVVTGWFDACTRHKIRQSQVTVVTEAATSAALCTDATTSAFFTRAVLHCDLEYKLSLKIPNHAH